MRTIEPIPLAEMRAARERIAPDIVRTPLVRLAVDGPAEIYLKLETLQPIGSFKLRGALNAIGSLSPADAARGVYTASAGNMAQGLAWGARARGVPCHVIMPDSAPRTKIDATERLGARVELVPYDAWWAVLANHGRDGTTGRFVHPTADRDVIAGNASIGLEILEDLPGVDAVLVPFGGGGMAIGVASAARALAPAARVFGCEVATSTPLRTALEAGAPVTVTRTPSFVDGIGGRGVLPAMWPAVRELLAGALVAPLDEVARAVRVLAERARVVAEGAGATPVAVALAGAPGPGQTVCVVSGGNIDADILARILEGATPR